MSRDASEQVERDSESAEPGAELTGRLGFLLKHVQQRLYELTAVALAPYGISGRELSVLLVLDALGPTSQQDAARRLGVDRTTMVALIDALEAKSVVVRRPYEEDRRRNVVEFTERGYGLLEQARAAGDEAERRFLEPLELDDAGAERFRAQLRALL
jgi:DNA-binding MarR family transcriptional regulator